MLQESRCCPTLKRFELCPTLKRTLKLSEVKKEPHRSFYVVLGGDCQLQPAFRVFFVSPHRFHWGGVKFQNAPIPGLRMPFPHWLSVTSLVVPAFQKEQNGRSGHAAEPPPHKKATSSAAGGMVPFDCTTPPRAIRWWWCIQ